MRKQKNDKRNSHLDQAGLGNCPSLTLIIEALEAFQAFDPATRSGAIALRASEMGADEIDFYEIALQRAGGAA